MDGFLPPVAAADWLDFQRRRARQLAQERIAAAGAGAGDWIGRASSAIDGLVPDWAQPQAREPELMGPPTPSPASLAVRGAVQQTQDWAQGALARIGQIGDDLGEQINGAQGIIPQVQQGWIGANAAPRPANIFTQGQYQPETPFQAAGGIANQIARGATEPVEDAVQRVQDSSSGMAGVLQQFGVPGPVANLAGFGAGALNVPGALGGANFQEQLRAAGASPELAGFGGDVAEIVTPNPIGAPTAFTRARQAATVGGALAGAGIGYATAPEDERLQNTIKYGLTGAQLGPDAVDLAAAGLRGARALPGALRGTDWEQALRTLAAEEVGEGRFPRGRPAGPPPGVAVSPEEIAARIARAQDAVHIWNTGENPNRDYVARLLQSTLGPVPAPPGPRAGAYTPGTTDWARLVREGRVDPDALNRALAGMREEGLSVDDALARGAGTPEERLAALQLGPEGVTGAGGLTKSLLQKAVADLGAPDPATGLARPFVTKSEQGAFKVGRNEPPPPTSRKNAWEYVDKNGKSWWLSSPYEVWFAKQLDENPNVAYWAQSSPETVMETTVRHGGEPKVFSPDFIIVGTDGRVQVVEIKNYGSFRQVPWRVPEKLREAEDFFNSKGVGFSIFVEDQLGRQALGRITPDDFLPNAEGRMGVRDGFFVENEGGTKVGRFDPGAARQELVKRLQEAVSSWDTNELGYLSGHHPVTQAEYDELLTATHWPAWAERYDRRKGPNGERLPAVITPAQRQKIIAAGVGGSNPAEGGYGRPYEWAEPLPPEQGGYDPRWTPHRAFAEFNDRQRRKGAPTIAIDAVEAYPQMRRATGPIFEHWAKQVAGGQHGMTVDPLAGRVGVPGRYAVSIAPGMELEFAGRPDQLHPDRLAMWMAEMEPLLTEIPNARVGFWYDMGSNRTYLDVSIGLDDHDAAVELGKRMSQKAIYDSVAGKDINLRYPGLPAGQRPPPPSLQEQEDALVRFGQQPLRQQRGGAGAAGAAAGAGDGDAAGALGAPQRGGAGRLAAGVPGAEAPGSAGDAGSGVERLGDVAAGVGGTGAADAPDLAGAADVPRYQYPVPYTGDAAGSGAPGGLGQLGQRLAGETGSATPQGALDLALGAGSGAIGYATADEGATPEERLARAGAFGAAGLGIGPGVRALNRASDGGLTRLLSDELGGKPTGATRAQRKLAAAQGRTPRAGTVALSDIPTILGSVPLMAPSSLAANFTGGMARSLERVLGQAFELRPIDAAVDLWNMAKAVPGATGAFAKSVRRGPTAGAQGAMGAPVKGDLSTRGGKLPGFLTSGVRINAATDQFWRDLNEAGGRAVAERRGLTGAAKGDFARRAGDYATFTGDNSVVAKKLTEMKGALHDPNANLGDKIAAGIVTAHAPYIMMPERLLRATVLAPVEQGYGVVAALKRGDPAAAREAAGRLGVSMGALGLFYAMYQQGSLTGDRPTDPNEARRREAQGAQWNTIDLPAVGKVPTRYLGSLGMQASMMASVLDAAKRAEAKGADPGAVWEARANELVGWAFDNSYLADLSDFANALGERRFADAGREAAAGTLARAVPLVPGILNAADPYEREAADFPDMVAGRVGLRATEPTRIDPTTGEDQRRRGSGFSRYFGERGSVQTPEAVELARVGLQPRVIGRTEEYEGAKQTPEQRRIAQRASGSETGRALRAAINTAEYRRAPDDEKKKLLQAALREAAGRADIAAGERVSRSKQSEADRAWQAVPKYDGVEGTPDEIRRQNAAIARAKAAQAAAKKKGDDALDRWERENPAQADLAATKPVNPRYLALDREDIEAKYGVSLGG